MDIYIIHVTVHIYARCKCLCVKGPHKPQADACVIERVFAGYIYAVRGNETAGVKIYR